MLPAQRAPATGRPRRRPARRRRLLVERLELGRDGGVVVGQHGGIVEEAHQEDHGGVERQTHREDRPYTVH